MPSFWACKPFARNPKHDPKSCRCAWCLGKFLVGAPSCRDLTDPRWEFPGQTEGSCAEVLKVSEEKQTVQVHCDWLGPRRLGSRGQTYTCVLLAGAP